MTHQTRRTVRAALGIAALFTVAACDDDNPTGPSTNGRIRAVHAVSNVAALDMLLNTTVYKTNVAYKADDGYRSVQTGDFTVRFRKAGFTTDLTTATTTVAASVDRTVIAMGTEAAPQTLVLTDNNAAPAAGKIKVRFVHAAIGTNALDAYILANANELPNATAAATNMAAKSASAYVDRDAGTYTIVFTTTGTKTAVLTMTGVQIAAGKIRTFVAAEKTGGGTPLEGITLSDN
jgi:Domain of unknown function (DUF4397)